MFPKIHKHEVSWTGAKGYTALNYYIVLVNKRFQATKNNKEKVQKVLFC